MSLEDILSSHYFNGDWLSLSTTYDEFLLAK